jgi:hypothetical protein
MLAVLAAVTLGAWHPREDCADDGPVRVTVVVVLASATSDKVDPKLRELAKEVRKRDDTLTGFQIAASHAQSIAVGDSAVFQLVDKKELKLKVEKPKDDNGRVGLTIKPPELGEITYTCTCDKFFPVVTPYKTKAGETLIVVVMAKPCTQKK